MHWFEGLCRAEEKKHSVSIYLKFSRLIFILNKVCYFAFRKSHPNQVFRSLNSILAQLGQIQDDNSVHWKMHAPIQETIQESRSIAKENPPLSN